MKSRIGFIVLLFCKNKIKYENVLKSCNLGRELAALINETHELPEGYKINQISLKGMPEPFEITFSMSNASDCADWLKDNNKELNNFLLPKIKLTSHRELVTI